MYYESANSDARSHDGRYDEGCDNGDDDDNLQSCLDPLDFEFAVRGKNWRQ